MLKQTHTTQHSLCGAVDVNVHTRCGLDADARQARRGIELTKVKSMRKTNSAIRHAVHNVVEEMRKVGVTRLVTPLSCVPGISK